MKWKDEGKKAPLEFLRDPPEPAHFQKYQHDPYFGSTAKNHLIRLSAEMMNAMTSDKSLKHRIKDLLAKARRTLVD